MQRVFSCAWSRRDAGFVLSGSPTTAACGCGARRRQRRGAASGYVRRPAPQGGVRRRPARPDSGAPCPRSGASPGFTEHLPKATQARAHEIKAQEELAGDSAQGRGMSGSTRPRGRQRGGSARGREKMVMATEEVMYDYDVYPTLLRACPTLRVYSTSRSVFERQQWITPA